jgi:hypothetical protein
MDWYDLTEKFHTLTFDHDCRLASLPEEWQRELAALWRLEADVNNGAYLQFFANWGRESYEYASRALRKVRAKRLAKIVDRCQSLVDKQLKINVVASADPQRMLPNPLIATDGTVLKEEGSCLPQSVLKRLYKLSYQFMEYPDDLASLGLAYYGQFLTEPDPPAS